MKLQILRSKTETLVAIIDIENDTPIILNYKYFNKSIIEMDNYEELEEQISEYMYRFKEEGGNSFVELSITSNYESDDDEESYKTSLIMRKVIENASMLLMKKLDEERKEESEENDNEYLNNENEDNIKSSRDRKINVIPGKGKNYIDVAKEILRLMEDHKNDSYIAGNDELKFNEDDNCGCEGCINRRKSAFEAALNNPTETEKKINRMNKNDKIIREVLEYVVTNIGDISNDIKSSNDKMNEIAKKAILKGLEKPEIMEEIHNSIFNQDK